VLRHLFDFWLAGFHFEKRAGGDSVLAGTLDKEKQLETQITQIFERNIFIPLRRSHERRQGPLEWLRKWKSR
jgi:hypothetical protein